MSEPKTIRVLGCGGDYEDHPNPKYNPESSFAAPTGLAATPYEVKSIGGKDYYICLRDTEIPLARILRSTLNKELVELKKYLDGNVPLSPLCEN